MAKRFSDTVRYINDLLTLNNSNFEEEIPNIYPPELTFKRTSESFTKLSYHIPANPTYGVYISQLIRISRICDTSLSFVIRHRLLTEIN